jgi:two-component system, LuxR family, sensor kinase FixL
LASNSRPEVRLSDQTDEASDDIAISYPLTLVRSVSGTVLHWPPGMERLFGHTKTTALGRISHDLLRTLFPRPLSDIESELLRHGQWNGGVVHRRRDGKIIAVNTKWLLRRGVSSDAPIVEETHTDIMETSPGEVTCSVFADLLVGLTRELSQPLTVMEIYIRAAARALDTDFLGRPRQAHQAMTQALSQGERGKETVRLIQHIARRLAEAASPANDIGPEMTSAR